MTKLKLFLLGFTISISLLIDPKLFLISFSFFATKTRYFHILAMFIVLSFNETNIGVSKVIPHGIAGPRNIRVGIISETEIVLSNKSHNMNVF